MKKFYYSRKLKELKVLSRRVRFLLNATDQEAHFKLQKLRLKIAKLLSDLRFYYSSFHLKRILGAAVLVFSLSFSKDTNAQWFVAPVENPFGLSGVNSLALPAAADLDNDGDLDLLVGEYYGVLQYFENTGSASDPSFASPLQNPFNLVSAYYYAVPAFADLDNDGDLDLLINEYYGVFQYFENIGSASAPDFDVASTNPFGLDSSIYLVSPVFVDLDNDGDFDILGGSYVYYGYSNGGIIKYYENIGTASSPSFADPVENPFSFVNPDADGGFIFPSLGDLDDDGDLDLLTNSYNGVFYYENTGSASTPEFASAVQNPFNLSSDVYKIAPMLIDLDDDGDLDLLFGGYSEEYSYTANFQYFENIGSEPLGINKIENASEISLYPNPVNELLTINTKKAIDRVELIDVLGKTSMHFLNGSNQLSVGDVSPGMYTLKISFSDGSFAIKKILKE